MTTLLEKIKDILSANPDTRDDEFYETASLILSLFKQAIKEAKPKEKDDVELDDVYYQGYDDGVDDYHSALMEKVGEKI